MAKALNLFGLDVIKDVPGMPMPIVERAVRQAAIEFCEVTLTWRQALADITLADGAASYTLTPPDESRIVTVIYCQQDDVRVLPTTQRLLDDSVQGWRRDTVKAGTAQWYYLPDRSTISIALRPDATGTLQVLVALKPTWTCRTLPDLLYDDNLDAIRDGALMRLMRMPGDNQNQDLANYYEAQFERAKNREKAERLNDYTRESKLVFGHCYG